MNSLIEKIKKELSLHDGIIPHYSDEFSSGCIHGKEDLAGDIFRIIKAHEAEKPFVIRNKFEACVAFISKDQIAFSTETEDFLYFSKNEAYDIMDRFPNIILEAKNKEYITL